MLQKLSLQVIIPILFFISGSAGLIYEIIWTDLLTNLLGSSSVAVSIILTAFMGGLALGSIVLGRVADSWNDSKIIKTYVFIEIGIGLYALSFPFIVSGVENFYINLIKLFPQEIWFSVITKSAFSIVILILPTFLMGGTLPLITRVLSRNWDEYSKNVSLLYGLNTFGAILGTLIAGFYLLEHYGISGASAFAASINFVVALLFFLLVTLGKSKLDTLAVEDITFVHNKKKKKKPHSQGNFDEFAKLLLISYFLSGAAAMFYQVAWTRSLSLILGTSTYAFTVMLATFLLGIALGSLLFRYIPKTISKVHIYIAVQTFIVVSVLFFSTQFDKLPLYYLSFVESYFDKWTDIHYIRFILAGMIMLLPTIAMGILFPVVCELVSEHSKKMSHVVGKTYSTNAFGAMFGALISGLLIIPIIGLQYTIYLGAFLNLFAMIIILLQTVTINSKPKIIYFSVAFVGFMGFLFLAPKWSPKVMSSGVYVYSDNYFFVSDKFDRFAQKNNMEFNDENIWLTAMKNYDLLYYKDGQVDTVSVMKNQDGVISLMVNGKVDASAKGEHDIATQIMIGQLPLLLQKDPKKIFLVGYASGITAGSILTHNSVKKLVAAEISPSVVQASKLFSKYNNNALSDPRLDLRIKDARHSLMVSNEKFDVIVSQPSNPWIKGQSSLFSYDWYKIVNEHLNDDGIFMQWLPAYSISEYNLKVILNTLDKSFKTLTLWTSTSPGDLIILATKNDKFRSSNKRVLERMEQVLVKKQLQKIGLYKKDILQELFLKSNKEIQAYLKDGKKIDVINSDDKLLTEYTTPKNMVNEKYIKLFSKPKYLVGDENTLEKLIPDINK